MPSTTNVGSTFTATLYATLYSPGPMCELGALAFVSTNLEIVNATAGNINCGAPFINSNPQDVYFKYRKYDVYEGQNGQYSIINIQIRALRTGTGTIQLDPSYGYFNYDDFMYASKSLTIYEATCPSGQTGIPPNCTSPPPDVCPNIAGSQTTIPSGMVKDASGNCVTPSTPPPPSTSPPPTQTTSPQRTSPQPTSPDVTAPQNPTSDETDTIRNISISRFLTYATISWDASKPLHDIVLRYGAYGKSADIPATITPTANGFSAKLTDLNVSSGYFFTISAKTESNSSISYEGALYTKGYPIELTILRNNTPLGKTEVKINGTSMITNNEGIITFDRGQGDFSAEVITSGKTYKQLFTVKALDVKDGGISADIQRFSFDIGNVVATTNPAPNWANVGFAVLGIILTVGIALGFITLVKRRRNKPRAVKSVTGYYSDPTPKSVHGVPPHLSPEALAVMRYPGNTSDQSHNEKISHTSTTTDISHDSGSVKTGTSSVPPADHFAPWHKSTHVHSKNDTVQMNQSLLGSDTTALTTPAADLTIAHTANNSQESSHASHNLTSNDNAAPKHHHRTVNNLELEEASLEDIFETARKSHRFDNV
ncbi:MAG: hypothetical protein WBB39_04210 [Candidatus Saccharimonadales bacterium]